MSVLLYRKIGIPVTVHPSRSMHVVDSTPSTRNHLHLVEWMVGCTPQGLQEVGTKRRINTPVGAFAYTLK